MKALQAAFISVTRCLIKYGTILERMMKTSADQFEVSVSVPRAQFLFVSTAVLVF